MTAQGAPSTPAKYSPLRIIAAILAFVLAARAAIQAVGTILVILIQINSPVHTDRINPTVLHIASGVACVLVLIDFAVSAIYLLGGLKLLKSSAAWTKYLLVLSFAEIALLLALNDVTIYVVTTVCSRLAGISYDEYQRVVNAELALTISPAGCVGDACASVVVLAVLVTLTIMLFKLRAKK